MSLTQELETIRDWLRYAVSEFNGAGLYFGHGTTRAYDEAAYLILHSLHLPLDRLEPFLDAKVTHAERESLQEVLARRVNERIPAPYLTHQAWLGDYRFYVDERVLIPRSYIAELLREDMTTWVPDPTRIETALDLCTGSGCLAILLAYQFPNADVDAADISSDALAVALRNVTDYGLQGRVNLIRSDLFSNLTEKRYDLIVTNPPYVTSVAMEELPPEYRHEPSLALAGGDDGLDAVRTILEEAAEFLTPEGVLIVEVGSNRAAAEAAFPCLPFTWLATPSSEESVFLLRRADLVAGERAAA